MSALRTMLERLLLTGFTPDEAADITGDLRELAGRRGPVRGAVYYWVELAKYPVRRWLENVRSRAPAEARLASVAGDARLAVRGLLRNPGFAGMAVAILTISMGAVTAIFGVVQGVLLEPLPVHRPDRLFAVWIDHDERGPARMTPGNFRDIAELDGAFVRVAAFGGQTASLDLGDRPLFLRGSRVTPEYFETLGVDLAVGRGFTADDGEIGGAPVVVLGHRIWTEAFGADPGVVGRTVRLDGADFDVVGVASPGVYPTHATVSAELPFTTADQDFFVPLRYGPDGWANRRSHVLGMIGRVADDGSVEVVEERLETLAAELRATEPLNEGDAFRLNPITEEVVGDVRFALLMLLGTAGLVLLIAVVNVGALFTLRAEDRRPEVAVRVAMGAPRTRLLRQLLLESAAITAVSCALAIVVARTGLGVMRGLVPYQIPRLETVTLDAGVLAVAALVGAAATAVFALLPATGLRPGVASGMAGRSTDSPLQRRVQGAVVGLQAALGVVVLVGAVLLTRSYGNLRAVDPGFDGLDTWTLTAPGSSEALDLVLERIRELPGVEGAARAYDHPFSRSWGDAFRIVGRDVDPAAPAPSASLRPYGPDYPQTVGLRVVEGRLPDRVDLAGEVGYAFVNESLARTFFAGESPLGRTVELPTAQRMFGDEGRFEIVAVVEDVRFLGPGEEAGPALYVPLTHFPVTATTLLVRPVRPDVDVLPDIRRVVAEVDPGLGIQQAMRLQDVLDDLLARPRFNMLLLLSLALVALLLCGLGAYGLMGRSVSRRVREIGIQMTLGAERARVARTVVGSALRPMAVGVLAGTVVAFAGSRLLRSVLFGVAPGDPSSYLAGGAFVLLVGLLAALGPTARAVSIDPAAALREQ